MAWRGGTYCLKCLQDDIEKKVPPLRRRVQDVDCPIHGHPAFLPHHLRAWVDFFNLVVPYTTQTGLLNIDLIGRICDEYQIKFTDAFYWLNIIMREVQKRDAHQNNGT